MIKNCRHQDIDRQKWDAVIRQSEPDMPYALSWYLDIVSPGWDGLVMNDYEAVMPLCRKSRFGIDYLFQPFLAQQMGVFSTFPARSPLADDFLSAIPRRYKWIDMHLNEMNHPEHMEYVCVKRKNFTIDLRKDFQALQQNYSRNCRRNIRKAEKAGWVLGEDLPAEKAVSFLNRYLAMQVKNLDKDFFAVLESVVGASVANGSGMLLSVQQPETGEVVAAGWFLKNDSRLCFQACASTIEGKAHESMYLLMDHALRKHASSGRIFDFTGSNLPGVAYFNASFGATLSAYPAVYRNTLPFLLKLLKKKPAWVNPSGLP